MGCNESGTFLPKEFIPGLEDSKEICAGRIISALDLLSQKNTSQNTAGEPNDHQESSKNSISNADKDFLYVPSINSDQTTSNSIINRKLFTSPTHSASQSADRASMNTYEGDECTSLIECQSDSIKQDLSTVPTDQPLSNSTNDSPNFDEKSIEAAKALINERLKLSNIS